VVEVETVAVDEPGAPRPVPLLEPVDLLPEPGFVGTEVAEEGGDCMLPGIRVLSKSQIMAMTFCGKTGRFTVRAEATEFSTGGNRSAAVREGATSGPNPADPFPDRLTPMAGCLAVGDLLAFRPSWRGVKAFIGV